MSTGPRPVAMGWPPVGAAAELRHLAVELELTVRASDGELLVATMGRLPSGNIRVPPRGAEVLIAWGNAAGLHHRPAVLTRQEQTRLRLRASGEVDTTQRRRFFRAPVTVDLTLLDGPARLAGRTVDLSEGGARVTLPGGGPGTPRKVTARLRVDGDVYDVPGTIVRTAAARGGTEIGLQFSDLPERCADIIRREVFTAQVAARKTLSIL